MAWSDRIVYRGEMRLFSTPRAADEGGGDAGAHPRSVHAAQPNLKDIPREPNFVLKTLEKLLKLIHWLQLHTGRTVAHLAEYL